MDTEEEEDILAIYINLIDMVYAFAKSQMDFIFSIRNCCKLKKSYTEYSFAENDKYKLLKGNWLLANAFPSYFFIFKLIYSLTK